MTDQLKIVRLGYIRKASASKPEVVPQLIRSFQWKLPRMNDALAEAFTKRDKQVLGLIAYQIKEILPVLGIREIGIELAAMAEECLGEPDWRLCEQRVNAFSEIFPLIMADLDQLLASLQAENENRN